MSQRSCYLYIRMRLLAHTGKEFEDVFPNILSRASLILDLFYGFSLIRVIDEHICLMSSNQNQKKSK